MKLRLNTKKSKIIAVVAACLAVTTLVGVFIPFATKKASGGGGSSSLGQSSSEPRYGYRDEDYAKLYEQQNLLANYLMYDGTSVSFQNQLNIGGTREVYSWKNQVAGGQNATFVNPDTWTAMDGGIGYRWYLDSEERPMAACELPFEELVEDLEVCSIDIVCKYFGITDRETGCMYRVDDPKKAKFQTETTFRFGHVHSNHFLNDAHYTLYSSGGRWYASNTFYNRHGNKTSDVALLFTDRDLGYQFNNNLWGETFRFDKEAFIMTIVTENLGPNSIYTEFVTALGYTARGEDVLVFDEHYVFDEDYRYGEDPVSRYTIFNGFPGVIYAVRLYGGFVHQKFQGDDYYLRNWFVDMLAFYKINVASILALDEDVRVKFLFDCANAADYRNLVFGNTDPDVMKENREEIEDIIRTYWPK